MHARVAEEGCAGGTGEVADVLCGNVADDVAATINDGDAAKAFFVHKTECIGQGSVRAAALLAGIIDKC